MRASIVWIGLLIAGFGLSSAGAQGTAVQLPSYSYFTTNSSVLVPDRGSAYLGGVNRARSGMNEFGTPLTPLRNRSFGSQRIASGASASVYVHDFEAMDEMLLGPDFQKRGGDLRSAVSAGAGDPRRALSGDPRRALDPRGALAPHRASAASAGASLASVTEILAQRRRDQEARQAEAQDFFERGQSAEEAGKMNVARVYYQMAAKRASGPLKEQVSARLGAIPHPQPARLALQK
jgi:hypothetical protein